MKKLNKGRGGGGGQNKHEKRRRKWGMRFWSSKVEGNNQELYPSPRILLSCNMRTIILILDCCTTVHRTRQIFLTTSFNQKKHQQSQSTQKFPGKTPCPLHKSERQPVAWHAFSGFRKLASTRSLHESYFLTPTHQQHHMVNLAFPLCKRRTEWWPFAFEPVNITRSARRLEKRLIKWSWCTFCKKIQGTDDIRHDSSE